MQRNIWLEDALLAVVWGAGRNHWVEQCEQCENGRILGEILGLVAPRKSCGYATEKYICLQTFYAKIYAFTNFFQKKMRI